jgi:4-amino-4-deoxy-L-arabinose transferase-like glycosyltransferase
MEDTLQRRDTSFLWLIVILAFTLRLVFVFFPENVEPFSDMRDYDLLAQSILEEGAYGPAERPPLYPLFLATVYRFAGASYINVRAVQAVLGTIVCLLVYGIGMRLGGAGTAKISSFIVAVYPSLVVYTCLLMSENLFIFLLTGALWLLLRGGKRSRPKSLLAGIFIGLACLTRSMLIGFVPLAVLWLLLYREKYSALLCIIGAVIVISPWTIRNYNYYNRFVPIDTFSGYNFLIGNHPGATGRLETGMPETLHATYWKECKDDAQKSAVGYGEGMKFIREHPAGFLALGVKKTGYLYGLEIRDLSWGYSMNYFGQVPRQILIPVAVVIIAAFPVICVLALCGFFLREAAPGRVCGAWVLLVILVLYFSAAHFISFGESRFHLPLIPPLALLAGRLASGGAAHSSIRYRGIRLALFVILLVLLSINWGLHCSENWQRLADVLGPNGNTSALGY